MSGLLIAFGGLPGTGKTTLARALARDLGATYLRIDVIEQAVRSANSLTRDVGPVGYLVGYALAQANLELGQTVVADSVNPLGITRQAWRNAAQRAGAMVLDVEVTCSDPAEHRRRVEQRVGDIEGLALPSWEDVTRHEYEVWDEPRLVLDTACLSLAEGVQTLRMAAVQARS